MKKLKYILLFILSVGLFNSCLIDNETDLDGNASGNNVVTFDRIVDNLTCTANGDEYTFNVKVKVVGPTVMNLTGDITVNVNATANSTARSDDHYRIVNPTITLTKENNYLAYLTIILMSEGNSAPMDGTPEFEDYEAPMLYLELAATGAPNVVGSGKEGQFTLNFTPPNPYAGEYDVEMRYFHPSAGGSHPSFPDFDPDSPYGGIRYYTKTLAAVTGRKCETEFAIWEDLCWITINADNSIKYEVDDTWTYDVGLGNPYDATQVSHFDPETGKIYLYYNYMGSGGYRIFWEVFTPVAKK